MPQPLSRIRPDAGYQISGVRWYPQEARPDLLILAMRVITAWSTMESFMARAFVTMLGANAEPAVAIYQALTSTSAQKQALRAAAQVALSCERERELFEVLLTLFSRYAKPRNRIAHWIWGVSDDIDGVLLVPPEVLIQDNVRSEKSKAELFAPPRPTTREQLIKEIEASILPKEKM